MNIIQLQTSYDPEQDRLLLRVNTECGVELRLWLTRRLLNGFLPIWYQAVAHARGLSLPAAATPQARIALLAMERSQVAASSNSSQPFQEVASPTQLPFGDLPLLVSEVRLTPLENGNLHTEWLRGLEKVGLELGPALMHNLSQLFENGVASAQWGISHVNPMPLDVTPPVKH